MVTSIGGNAEHIALAPTTGTTPGGPANTREIEDGQKADGGFKLFGKDGFTFWDFLDIINPLQHIPVISTLYRSLTGDEIDPGAKIAGSTLFGGPFGAAISTLDVAIEHNTGQDIAEHAVAFFTNQTGEPAPDGTPPPPSPPVEVAALSQPALNIAAQAERPVLVNSYAPVQKPADGYIAGMSGIPVAKNSSVYAAKAATYHPAEAPDLGMLSQINQTTVALEQSALSLNTAASNQQSQIWSNPKVEKGPMKLLPKHRQILQQKPVEDAALTPAARDKLADLTSTMNETKKGWVVDAMMNAMDKYQASSQLGLPQNPPAISVTR